MDESVISGANLFFAPQFGIDPMGQGQDDGKNQWLLGLVNSAPYVRSTVSLTRVPVPIHVFASSSAVPLYLVGSPHLSITFLADAAPFSSAHASPSLLASGKLSPTHGRTSLLHGLS